jgi:hypothetical protein
MPPGYRDKVARYRHPRPGIEFDWNSLDRRRHVGVFSTAGYRPVPREVMPLVQAFDEAYPDQIASLAVVTSCAESPEGPGNFSDWIAMAERGLFGFDWEVWDGPYVRLTAPSFPITVEQFPTHLAWLAQTVVLDVEFTTSDEIDLGSLGVALDEEDSDR